MSRLILPCKALSLSKTCLMGLISSAPLQRSFRITGNSVKKVCRQFLCCENTIRRNCQSLYYSLNRGTNIGMRFIGSVATESLPKEVEQSNVETPKEIFLKDYKQPDYFFEKVDLIFQLGEETTLVFSKIAVSPRVEGCSSPLVLDGSDLILISLKVNGKELKEDTFSVDSRHLTLSSPPSGKFTLEIVTEICPQKNTSLEGLYKSSGNFCTLCEAEGFRKITFFQDRPDIMAKYTCRIEAEKLLYPVLLSNGNLTEQGELEGGLCFFPLVIGNTVSCHV